MNQANSLTTTAVNRHCH